MKFSQSLLFLLASTLVNGWCDLSSDGNYYCSATKKVTYDGVGYSGSYPDVTAMNDDGSCDTTPKSFSGNLSPLNEELSLHFRGPLKLKQFGVYYPSSSSKSKKKREEDCATTLVHKHHLHKRATKVVEVTQTVFVDANGNTQTVATTSTSTGAAASSAVGGKDTTSTSVATTTSSTSSAAATSSSSSSDDDDDDEAAGDWTRSSYYTPGTADNVVFFNYYGGSGSGVWSSAFGNSISYANSDMTGGASSPQVMDDITIGSNTEYMIMSGDKCSGNDCGYYRPGIPAYHGFDGTNKIFVFEFQMPEASGSKTAINYDMPAIWALNAKIPRTLQYGSADCTCWPDCGELDLFEILSAGSDKLISHLHSGQTSKRGGGGSQDYFERPYSSTIKAAVIFDGDAISIVQVDDSTNFGSGLSQSTVDGWISESGSKASIGY